jgi:serine/threonine protein phosphatase PrpC
VVALLEDAVLYTANVGDSRAILCRKKGANSWEVSDVTRDHKPSLEHERSRIVKAGGRVDCFRDEMGQKVGPERVWARHQNIPGLAMSRSIGDNLAKAVGVICVPDVMRFSLQLSPQFLMLASDGVWDYLSKEEVAQLVVPFFERGDVEGACDSVLEEAYARWTEEDDEVVDDITFILAFMTPN